MINNQYPSESYYGINSLGKIFQKKKIKNDTHIPIDIGFSKILILPNQESKNQNRIIFEKPKIKFEGD